MQLKIQEYNQENAAEETFVELEISVESDVTTHCIFIAEGEWKDMLQMGAWFGQQQPRRRLRFRV